MVAEPKPFSLKKRRRAEKGHFLQPRRAPAARRRRNNMAGGQNFEVTSTLAVRTRPPRARAAAAPAPAPGPARAASGSPRAAGGGCRCPAARLGSWVGPRLPPDPPARRPRERDPRLVRAAAGASASPGRGADAGRGGAAPAAPQTGTTLLVFLVLSLLVERVVDVLEHFAHRKEKWFGFRAGIDCIKEEFFLLGEAPPSPPPSRGR